MSGNAPYCLRRETINFRSFESPLKFVVLEEDHALLLLKAVGDLLRDKDIDASSSKSFGADGLKLFAE